MKDAFRIRHIENTLSTNEDAKAAAVGGEAAGLVIWADSQSKGRGRQGKHWQSPPGNLYFSLLLRPMCRLAAAFQYGFVAGLSLQTTLAPLLPGKEVLIKWPNDILVGKKKMSGILLETSSTGGADLEWLIIGIGINVLSHPTDLPYPATSLKAEGASQLELAQLLATACENFCVWMKRLEKGGFPAIRQAWLTNAQKGPLSVHLTQEQVVGSFADLGEDGSLILDLANGQKRAIAAGDVFVG